MNNNSIAGVVVKRENGDFNFGNMTISEMCDLLEKLIEEINRRKENKTDVGFWDKNGNYKEDLQPVENPVNDYGLENAITNAKLMADTSQTVDIFNQKIFDFFLDNYKITLLQDEMQQIKNLCFEYWVDEIKGQQGETLIYWLGALVSELETRNLIKPDFFTPAKIIRRCK